MKITISKSSDIAIRFAEGTVNAWIFPKDVIFAYIKWKLLEFF